MVWFKVDDTLALNLKVLRAGNAAMGLWVRAGAWSGSQLSDGVVPEAVVPVLGGTSADAEALVAAGLWERVEGAYVFHDWEAYQPTRAAVEADRSGKQSGGLLGNHRRWHESRGLLVPGCRWCDVAADRSGDRSTDRSSDMGTDDGGHRSTDRSSESSRPDPTRPDRSTHVGSGGVGGTAPRKRGTRIPDPFVVTTEMREWAASELGPVDVDASTRTFVDYWRGKAGRDATKLDWAATWRNWLRRDDSSSSRARASAPTPTERAVETMRAARRVQERMDSRDRKELAS